jgi:glutamate-1-semialdehyde 2,1-aminomutase
VGRTRDVLAYGGRHQLMLRPLYDDEQGVYPEFFERAHGYELTDTDGRTYVDWLSAWGPVVLGYGHPAVEEAITRQLAAGPLTSLAHPLETEVAELLVDMIPCAEMVAFGKNGSDVVTAAVRIARAVTGRELILQCGFHGFHDWYVCQYKTRNVKGIPTALRAFVEPFPYHDLAELERLFHRYPDEVAAVVMEPVIIDPPAPGYLEGVQELCRRNDALLVFDEMITGFRLANGGAQEFYGVTPDLACFGKGLANGMPLAAIVGKREHMRRLPDTSWGMTFRGETLSLAAARATLGVLRDEPVVAHLARIGEELRSEFHAACVRTGVRCELRGAPARMTLMFDDAGGFPGVALRRLFVRESARHGVLLRAGIMPSYAHDRAAIDCALPAFEAGLAAVSDAVQEGQRTITDAVRSALGRDASAYGRAQALPDGSIDAVAHRGAALEVTGWVLLPDGPVDEVRVVAPSGHRVVADQVARPDLAEAFPTVTGAGRAGWSAALPSVEAGGDAGYAFEIHALRGTTPVMRLPVGYAADRGPLHPGPVRDPEGALRL